MNRKTRGKNQMEMGFNITDEDIRDVEKLLNVENVDFSDDQRQEAIKTLETKDIRACPGSGKTTLLVAKLAILARKWPHSHQGICVLSHTNVARDQIVKKLPVSSSQRLLSYPHFVGTIQSFIDRFVAIPACLARFHCTPSSVDNARFASVAQYEYRSGPYTKLRGYLNNQQNRKEIIDDLQFRWDGGLKVDLSKTRLTNEDSSSYKQLLHLKEKVSGEGVFRFEDMFALAKWYMTEYPRIADLVAKRFPLVFIDEMQDTDTIQDDVLFQLFGTKSILQRFGDPNQAIFENSSAKVQSSFPSEGYLTIEKSYRVSSSIAEKIERMCLIPQKIEGKEERANLKHTIILFNEATIKDVLDNFGELVLRECGNFPPADVRAVGAVGKKRENQKKFPYSITDYWPGYTSKKSVEQRKQETFDEYVRLAAEKIQLTKSCGNGRDVLLDGLVEVLRLQECRTPEERYYTHRKLVECLKDRGTDSLKCLSQFLYKHCQLLIANETSDGGQLASDVKQVLAPLLSGNWNENVDDFLSSKPLDSVSNAGDAEDVPPRGGRMVNVYKYIGTDQKSLDISLTTIHQAKGQTHNATLVLETFVLRKHDLKDLLHFLLGERPEDIDELQKKYLKQIFVAMSRPKYLVCLAMNKKHLSEKDITKLGGLGWSFVHQNRKAQSSLFDFYELTDATVP